MTMLRLLAFGVGLGSLWVCSREGVASAEVGCAINCADWTMEYQRGVKPYWLHIAYHGRLDSTNWRDRVMGAMRLVLQTLLRGEDAAVHCAAGLRRERGVCLWFQMSQPGPRSKGPKPMANLSFKLVAAPRSQVHETSEYLFSIPLVPRQTSVRPFLHHVARLFVLGPRSS